MKPRRYQLTKDAAAIIARGHPWIFRDQLSSAASVFADGDRLKLVDASNAVVAHGSYEAEGAIAIRIWRRGPERPDARWLAEALRAAVARREPLHARTDGIRLVHGESDGIPAVVADRFGDTTVVTSYSLGSDGLARYVALALRGVLVPAQRRRGEAPPVRGVLPALAHFTEDGIRYAVDLAEGQKTGTYLDLRGLRQMIATMPLVGARVLDLFAYTGMLGRVAEAAGATSIVHVDQSARALDFARAHHAVDPARHEYVVADIFAGMPEGEFDLVIVDPPAMTSKKAQVPAVLAAYRRLYRAARERVKPGGAIVAACCTSRIERKAFHQVVRETTGLAMERELPPEIDHPVGFPQADYLKIAVWRA